MRSEVCYAPDGIALDLNIWRQHLTDEGWQTSKLNDEDLVLRYEVSVVLFSCLGRSRLTVDCEVSKSCASCPLHLNIGALEQEQYWLEGVAVDLPDICSASH